MGRVGSEGFWSPEASTDTKPYSFDADWWSLVPHAAPLPLFLPAPQNQRFQLLAPPNPSTPAVPLH